MQRTFSRGHTARRWQNWGLTPVLFNSSALSNLSVTSPKHNNFIFKIGPRTVSLVLTATTWPRHQPCLARIVVPASALLPSTKSAPFYHSCAQVPLAASHPTQQKPSPYQVSKTLTDSVVDLFALCCRLSRGSLSPPSPPFTCYSQPRKLSPRHLQGSPPSCSLLKCHLERISDAQYPI